MKTIAVYLCLVVACCCSACNKSDFLDVNPNLAHFTPRTISELQALLNRDAVMNGATNSGTGPVPFAGEAGADNYYLPDASYQTRIRSQFQNYYRWEPQVYDGYRVFNWDYPYQTVFYANVILDGLTFIDRTSTNAATYDQLLGGASFHRAHAFYQLAQVFAPPYNASSSQTAWGIPLRLTADIGEPVSRANLEDTYQFIINELIKASHLLTEKPALKTHASKQAAYALLARVYQTMQRYDQALSYADSCLSIQNTLLDYNSLNASLSYPFSGGSTKHPEVIFACNMLGLSLNYPMSPTYALVDSTLYEQYEDLDLRKTVFFRSTAAGHAFKGSYEGMIANFAGLATDEMYLIKAECLTRLNQEGQGMSVLNQLLEKRWLNGNFTPLPETTQSETLELILHERRKELLFRGLRWTDLRRLNLEERAIQLSRKLNGIVYTLPPNDPRYTYPIPDEVIAFHPDMPQNIR